MMGIWLRFWYLMFFIVGSSAWCVLGSRTCAGYHRQRIGSFRNTAWLALSIKNRRQFSPRGSLQRPRLDSMRSPAGQRCHLPEGEQRTRCRRSSRDILAPRLVRLNMIGVAGSLCYRRQLDEGRLGAHNKDDSEPSSSGIEDSGRCDARVSREGYFSSVYIVLDACSRRGQHTSST